MSATDASEIRQIIMSLQLYIIIGFSSVGHHIRCPAEISTLFTLVYNVHK